MKNSIYKIFGFAIVFLILNSSFLINNCLCQWEQVSNGIGNQKVNALAVSGNYMFAGTELNGVYISADNGITWSQTSLTGSNVLCLAVAGTNIFAGTYSSGVYFSSDNGATWTQTALNNLRISGLAVIGSTVFAAIGRDTSTSGVYVTADNGATWTRTSLQSYTVSVIADGNTLYAGTMNSITGDKLYRSYDQGATWTPIFNRRIFTMYFGTGFMLAGYGGNNGGGISRSTDNGATWTTVLNNIHTYSLAGNGNYIFSGSYDQGAWFSTDYGISWDIRKEGFPAANIGIKDLEVYNNYVYAASIIGVWRNPNNYFTLFYDYGTYTGLTNWVTNQGWNFSWAIPNGAFTDSPGKNYSIKNYTNNANNSLTLKNPLNASNYAGLKVSFKHKYLTQAGKDFCRVEVSSNNGTTWAEAVNYSGTLDVMTTEEVDITNLANQSANLKIRFRLTSDNKIVNDGWYVTDIRVIGRTASGNIIDNIITNELSKNYSLEQNYPKPFNPVTKINFSVPKQGLVILRVYDVLGREVKTLVNDLKTAGDYTVEFDGSNLTSGIYFYTLITNNFSDTKKMLLIK